MCLEQRTEMSAKSTTTILLLMMNLWMPAVKTAGLDQRSTTSVGLWKQVDSNSFRRLGGSSRCNNSFSWPTIKSDLIFVRLVFRREIWLANVGRQWLGPKKSSPGQCVCVWIGKDTNPSAPSKVVGDCCHDGRQSTTAFDRTAGHLPFRLADLVALGRRRCSVFISRTGQQVK